MNSINYQVVRSKLITQATLGFLMTALLTETSARAATNTWNGSTTNWGTTTAWTPNAVPTSADTAAFSGLSANQTVNLGAARSANGITFAASETGTTSILGGGSAQTLTLGTGGITIASGAGAVTLGNGAVANDVLISLASGSQTWTNSSASAFTVNDSQAGFTRAAGATLTFNQASTGVFSINTTTLPNTSGIGGPWAFFGTGSSTKFATNSSGTIAGLTGTAAASGANLTDTTGTVNYDLAAGGGTVPATVSANTIRYTGAAGTTAPGGTSFTINGLLNAGTGLWTIGNNAITIGSTKELVVNTANADISIGGPIKDNAGGASSLTKTGSGTLFIAGTGTTGNVFTGTLYINQGTVNISTVSGAQAGLTGGIVDNGTLILNGTVGGSDTVNAAISGSGSVTISGNSSNGYAGFFLGAATNSFSGGLTINTNGQFRMNGTDASLGATGAGITLDGGQVQFRTTSTISSARTITLASGGGVLDLNGNNQSFGGTITGSGALAKTGTGTLTLTGTNNYSGYTSINNGTVTTGNSSALGTGQVALGGAGTTLNLNGTALTIDSLANALGQAVTISGRQRLW